MKSIRLNRETGEVACFHGTMEIFSVDTKKLKVDSEVGLLNFIKHVGSIESAIHEIRQLSNL